jgi:hypothetical protein
MDFCYLAQFPIIDEDTCDRIEASLASFHAYKQSIMDADTHLGKGNWAIENWHIPKLELMQSVVPNIRQNGVAIQWFADITEHVHITEIKDPAHAGNNQKYESQITHHLDHAEKCRQFDLETSVREAAINFGHHCGSMEGEKYMEVDPAELNSHHIHTMSELLDEIDPVSNLSGPSWGLTDYFRVSAKFQHSKVPNTPQPFCTFSVATTVFHLTCNANICGAAEAFLLKQIFWHLNKVWFGWVQNWFYRILPSSEL